jgi:hypothetical protein
MVIYGKKTFKTDNKTQPANMAATEPADSTNHIYRIYLDVFFATGRFKDRRFDDLTFCKPDVL